MMIALEIGACLPMRRLFPFPPSKKKIRVIMLIAQPAKVCEESKPGSTA